MSAMDRYDVSELPEAQWEPGSRRRVLRNLRGITSKREMDRLEAEEQYRTLQECITTYDRGHRFTAEDIRAMHRSWLGDVYPWAGNYRKVNVAKGGFPFAAAARIPDLMTELEHGPLMMRTPCQFENLGTVAAALAEVHVELVLIHPFRDGNGRLARMLAIVMAIQANLPVLDFGAVRGGTREHYFAAVRAGLDRNYKPMTAIFKEVIARSSQSSVGEREA